MAETATAPKRRDGTPTWVLPAIAERPGLTVVDLAEAFEVPRRTALDWLQKADRLGLIERRRARHPRALARCYLTAEGLTWLADQEEVA